MSGMYSLQFFRLTLREYSTEAGGDPCASFTFGRFAGAQSPGPGFLDYPAKEPGPAAGTGKISGCRFAAVAVCLNPGRLSGPLRTSRRRKRDIGWLSKLYSACPPSRSLLGRALPQRRSAVYLWESVRQWLCQRAVITAAQQMQLSAAFGPDVLRVAAQIDTARTTSGVMCCRLESPWP